MPPRTVYARTAERAVERARLLNAAHRTIVGQAANLIAETNRNLANSKRADERKRRNEKLASLKPAAVVAQRRANARFAKIQAKRVEGISRAEINAFRGALIQKVKEYLASEQAYLNSQRTAMNMNNKNNANNATNNNKKNARNARERAANARAKAANNKLHMNKAKNNKFNFTNVTSLNKAWERFRRYGHLLGGRVPGMIYRQVVEPNNNLTKQYRRIHASLAPILARANINARANAERNAIARAELSENARENMKKALATKAYLARRGLERGKTRVPLKRTAILIPPRKRGRAGLLGYKKLTR